MHIPTVAVIGLGYIGLPTATVLAMHGADVVGVDVDAATVDTVNRGEAPFVEPGLATRLRRAVEQGQLRAETKTPHADVYVIAVPTPSRGRDHVPDLSCVDAAVDSVLPRLVGGELILLESTSPPGTTQRIGDRVLAERPDLSLDGAGGRPAVHVAHCPERVLPGRIMTEIVENDRVVGGLTRAAAERARDLYATFCRGEILLTEARTAELTKLVENSYRDVNIAFANELAAVSARLGVDVWELIELANHHPRVDILQPGPGVGGHCIAVDPWFVVAAAPAEATLIRAAREINDATPERVVERVLAAVPGRDRPRVALLGLTFKADVDDLRGSPACQVARRVADALPHAQIDVVEPNVDELPTALAAHPHVRLRALYRAVDDADVVVVLVDHAEFRAADRSRLRLTDKVVVDTRGIWR
jgi:UDP-N-acetyl-D-mannosaminuronic acid dehydrogenase